MSKEVSLVNQQEKMARAKALTYERLKTALEDFEQVDEYSFASLENIEGEDWWTVVSIVAKKNYDIDEALEEFEIKKETKRKRQEEKEKKEKKKTSKSQSFFYIFFQKKIRKFLEKIQKIPEIILKLSQKQRFFFQKNPKNLLVKLLTYMGSSAHTSNPILPTYQIFFST